ncbi:MAG: cation-translocating P-type ATPase [Rubrivivax sp.]|nr:cation-translocating P-type ATPase [Rubrivivax sp.]
MTAAIADPRRSAPHVALPGAAAEGMADARPALSPAGAVTAAAGTADGAFDLAAVDDPVEQGRFTRWIQGPDGHRLGESSLQLAGLHCAACAGTIEEALRSVQGVQSARVSAAVQRASVCWDPARARASDLIGAVRAAGYEAVPDAAAPARALRRREARQALWRLFVAGFCSMQIMMMATPGYVAGPGDLAPDMAQLLNWGSWLLALPVLAFSATPFFAGAWRAVRTRRIGMDVPVALGVAITFVASTGATFAPGGAFGHEVYFDSLSMFVAFLLWSRWVEMRARHRAAEQLEASLARLPETAARVGPDGAVETVAVHRLRPGDTVRVPLGAAFPADGRLLDAATEADEALLSGESTPVPKRPGDEVVAASLNRGAPVTMRVERVGNDTRFEAIVSMMKSAALERPAAARWADRWAAPFLWTVLLLAAAAGAVWSVVDPARAVWVTVAVLIVTCPCALSLAAPATLVAATRALARCGLHLQRIDAIERLAAVQQVFFDKTGTLTLGVPRLREMRVLPPGGVGAPDALLAAAAALARWSQHPLARAVAAAAPAGVPAPALSDIVEVPGRGLSAVEASGCRWRLGAPVWVAAGRDDAGGAGDPAPSEPGSGGQAASGPARLVLGCEGRVCAEFEFEEEPRAGAAAAVAALREAGLHVTLLSGDAPDRAHALAARLGIDDVLADARPADKLAAVEAAQRQGRRVAMVGDGVNDAPVLARADVSIAMGEGALVSRAQADAVLVSDDLGALVAARRAALRAVGIVRQNLAWSATYNAVCIPLALAGWLPPWAAGIGMAASSLLVVLNALRASR